MRLARFTHAGTTHIGNVDGDSIVDLTAHDAAITSIIDVLAGGLGGAQAAAAASTTSHALGEVTLECPMPDAPNYLAIGLNYADHIAETGRDAPKFPMFFNKQISCLAGPSDPIHYPEATETLDYEGELGFVISRRCRHVPADRAHEVIGGYFVANDVSVRDWQRRAPTMTLGKSWDTHGPIGPWVTTADEVDDPHALDVKTWLNGELRQDSNTKHLIFDCFKQIEVLSTVMTLEPGTLVATGTSSGVGMAMDPPGLMSVGDVVKIEIEGLGTLENTVVAEPAVTVIE